MLAYIVSLVISLFSAAAPLPIAAAPAAMPSSQLSRAEITVVHLPLILAASGASRTVKGAVAVRPSKIFAASTPPTPIPTPRQIVIAAPALPATPQTIPAVSPLTPRPAAPSAAPPTPPAGSVSAPSSFEATAEQAVATDTNAERAKYGLPPLSMDPSLSSIARLHSEDMLTNDYFSHDDQSGCDTGCRLTARGYPWQMYGENIYWMSGYALDAEATAKKIVDGWIASPPHHENMLNPDYEMMGVGIATNGDKVYATAEYTVPL